MHDAVLVVSIPLRAACLLCGQFLPGSEILALLDSPSVQRLAMTSRKEPVDLNSQSSSLHACSTFTRRVVILHSP
jgi:hypothetical protein